jgi:hypothetical protein
MGCRTAENPGWPNPRTREKQPLSICMQEARLKP